jgi:hypothetical protein
MATDIAATSAAMMRIDGMFCPHSFFWIPV